MIKKEKTIENGGGAVDGYELARRRVVMGANGQNQKQTLQNLQIKIYSKYNHSD